MKKKICVLVDAGHGGNHPKTGEYMTPRHFGKRYTFTQINPNLEVREGVINRAIANQFCDFLKKGNIDFVKVYHDFIDTSNFYRAYLANDFWAKNRDKYEKIILLSFHSNADGMKDKGEGTNLNFWSVWTTRGRTYSDYVATVWLEETEKICGQSIQYRKEFSDGDADFEADFDILFQTIPSAVLVENLYFTNFEGAKKLLSTAYQKQSALSAYNMILKFI